MAARTQIPTARLKIAEVRLIFDLTAHRPSPGSHGARPHRWISAARSCSSYGHEARTPRRCGPGTPPRVRWRGLAPRGYIGCRTSSWRHDSAPADAIAARLGVGRVGHLIQANGARGGLVHPERVPGQPPAPVGARYRIARALDLRQRSEQLRRGGIGRILAEQQSVLLPSFARHLVERAADDESDSNRRRCSGQLPSCPPSGGSPGPNGTKKVFRLGRISSCECWALWARRGQDGQPVLCWHATANLDRMT